MNDYIEGQIRFHLTKRFEAEVNAEIAGRFDEIGKWLLPIVPVEKVLDVSAVLNELRDLSIRSAVARRTRDALDRMVARLLEL